MKFRLQLVFWRGGSGAHKSAEMSRIYRFERFTLDLAGGCLRAEDREIALRPKSFKLLRHLVENAGRLVSKDELMKALWPNVIVTDDSLKRCVSEVRIALGDEAQQIVRTVPRRGLRFIARLSQPATELAPLVSPIVASDSLPEFPPLPDKPSIAVLPFQNLGGDLQEYFADGIVEEIITALTRFSALFVIARNSSFAYKGRSIDVRQVGRELGVRYVLEGSARRSEDRLRITGQLIEAATGTHLWADRFEGRLTDIFDLQDEMTTKVVGALSPKLQMAEIERAKHKPTESLQSYDCYLRGLASFHREERSANRDALHMFYKAIELDPDFATPHGMAAWSYCQRLRNGWTDDLPRDRVETKRLALRAAALSRDDAVALCASGLALALIGRELDAGTALIDRARELNPNLAIAWSFSAWVRIWLGEPELAIEHGMRAVRLSPLDPLLHSARTAIAWAHFIAGRYETAASWAETARRDMGHFQGALRILAASHALLGRFEEARKVTGQIRQLYPELRIADAIETSPFRRPDDLSRYIKGLRIAGLPD